MQREVALKTHTVGADPDVQSVERFFREARVVASFKHQNIVTLFALGRDGDKVFIAMELLEGEEEFAPRATNAYRMATRTRTYLPRIPV